MSSGSKFFTLHSSLLSVPLFRPLVHLAVGEYVLAVGGEVLGLKSGGHLVGDERAGHEQVVRLLHLPQQHTLRHTERQVGLAQVADGPRHCLLILGVAAVRVLGEEL